MWETLNKIIKGCFEVYFGTAIAGLVFYTMQSCRKNLKVLLWVYLTLTGLLIWRFFIPNFYSTRYAVICILPATLLITFMMVKFKKWWWALVIIMSIVCCCKIFRSNFKGRLIIDAAAAISQDAVNDKYPLAFVADRDFQLMTLYSPVPVCNFQDSRDNTEKIRGISRIISGNAPYADVIYVCCDMQDNKELSGQDLGLTGGHWKLIYSARRTRKQKLYFQVYAYRNAGAYRPPLPPEGKNLILNGDAEKTTSLNSKILQIAKDKKITFLTGDPPFPAYWGIASFSPEQKFEIESSDDNPISGKSSFRMKTLARPCGLYSCVFTLHGRAEIFFRIRGNAGSVAEVALLTYKEKNVPPRTIPLLPVRILKENQVMTYSFSFDPSEYSAKGANFRLLFQCFNGEIFFDNVIVAAKSTEFADKKPAAD